MSSFVTLGGPDDGTRPTFFELIAAQRLVPSIKAALVYSLSVYAQQRPFLHRLLSYEEELIALVSFVLDRQSLWHSDGTFAESLYGLKRVGVGQDNTHLRARQRWNALLYVVAAPYLRAKLESIYLQHLNTASTSTTPPTTLRQRLINMCTSTYPWLHAGTQALLVGYQLAYLLNLTDFYSPGLHVVGQRVVRVSGREAAERQQRMAKHRAQQGPPGLVSRVAQLLADNTRNTVIAAVFLYKLLEWWYTSAEQQLAAQRQLAPPPPPPAPQPHANGIPLPLDVAMCPLCLKRRTNPAQLTVSGYVFCYPCLHAQLEARGCCPITLRVATANHVRRLYQE